jgi:hypothetical protein
MLHARMGGYIKETGFHLWSVVLGVIVAFSWFHVNVLGVGLHSYGFSKAVKLGVTTFYAVAGGVFAIGLAVTAAAAFKRRPRKPGGPAAVPEPTPQRPLAGPEARA